MRLAEERRRQYDREREEERDKRFIDFQREQSTLMRDMFAMVTGSHRNGSVISESTTRCTRSRNNDEYGGLINSS